ncbi:MAG: YfhO family protein [Firmicutes bacterium]|nr:YfhO family protein [Bacillota bacterium]
MKNAPINKIRKFFRRHRYAAAAFLMPALVLTLAFAATGIFPFGENQVTIIDMYHQYVPFLSELQYKLQHGGSPFYCWDGAGGFNFWALMAYYGGSPLNLLLALFPASWIVEGVTFVLTLKVGFSGMFMFLYLKRVYPRTRFMPVWGKCADNMSRVAFGTMYALSAYFLGYFWCIMWIDVMALLPLCILGLRRLTEGGRPILYAVALGLIVFCNYYIAIMVCLFIVLYYLVIWFEKRREGGWVAFAKATARVACYSLVGVALACPMFLPTWRSMQNAYYFADVMPEEWSFYHDPLEIVNQLLPNAHLCYREGLPNLYCGLFVVIMLVFYFMSRSIPVRQKIVNGLFLAMMFFSLNVNKIDFIWHGLHFPNELPFRYSFVISFVLVGLAFQAFLRLHEIREKAIWVVLGAGIGYYLLAAHILEGSLDDKDEFFYLGIGLLALYITLLALHHRKMIPSGAFACLLALVVAAEMLCSTTIAFERTGNVERDPYLSDAPAIMKLAEKTKEEFARTELHPWSIMNCPALYHYRGISQFASCLNAGATELMEKVGVEGEPGKNRYNYVFTSPVVNAMLNMKYIIANGEVLGDPRFVEKATEGVCTLYENTQPLSIAYVLPGSIRTWETWNANPFMVQDDYVRAATDNQVAGVFQNIDNPEFSADQLEINETSDGEYQTYGGDGVTGSATLSYDIGAAGSYYVFIEADQAETIQVFHSNGDAQDLREDCGAVVYIGDLAEGETVDVQINYKENGEGNIRCYVCRLDDEAWNRAYELISRDVMKVDGFGDTWLKGTVRASEDGVLTTSVLYEDGWTVRVDGKRQDIEELVGGDFISVPITEGQHEIEMRYLPSGLIPGVLLMIAGILALVLPPQLRQLWIRRRKSPEISDIGI